MFRSLRLFNFRVWFAGMLISFVGQWMQSTAQAWVVLTVLTDGDAAAMGIALALQFAPPLLLVGVTGWVADRFERRRLIAVTQSALLITALTVGILLITGVLTLGLMYGFALLFGIVTAFDVPARQAFVTDMVNREHAQNAVALNSAAFNLARISGPAAAGLLIVAVGSGWVFVINAVTYIAMLVALAVMRTSELQPRAQATSMGRLADGFRFVGRRADLVVLFVMVALFGAFGMNFPIYASTMALEFGQDAAGFGLLTTAFAIGALVGSLLVARRMTPRLRAIIVGALIFGLASLVSAFAPGYWWYAAALLVVGFGLQNVLAPANAYVQTTVDPAVRGRVLALYMAVLMGSTPFGAPIVGWIADHWGARASVGVAAGAGIAAAAIGFGWLVASGRLRRAAGGRLALEIVETRPIEVVPVPEEFSDAVAASTPLREDEDEDAVAPPAGPLSRGA